MSGDTMATHGAPRETLQQPRLQSRMCDQHGLRGQRIGRALCLQPARQFVRQIFGAAAAMHEQAGRVFHHAFRSRLRRVVGEGRRCDSPASHLRISGTATAV